jgi:ubiquitin C-terminal hydrolase
MNPVGFTNIGNTCYMNSVLQSLLSSSYLNKVFTRNKKPNRISLLAQEYNKIIEQQKDKKNITPSDFKKILGKTNNDFKGSRPHDAEEVLLTIMNEFIDGDIIDFPIKKKSISFSKRLNKICFGKIKQYIKCDKCSGVTTTIQPFLDLLLPLPKDRKKDIDINDTFQEYFKLEEINDWYCDKCKKNNTANMLNELEETPNLLIVTFKRFEYNMKKDTRKIKLYPKIRIDGNKYNLISTIKHSGGHYTSYISRTKDNKKKWYYANDSRITKSKIMDVIEDQNNYIAIYEKIKT